MELFASLSGQGHYARIGAPIDDCRANQLGSGHHAFAYYWQQLPGRLSINARRTADQHYHRLAWLEADRSERCLQVLNFKDRCNPRAATSSRHWRSVRSTAAR
ncbi:MAG: hypothetical protein ABI725_03020 [Chloroflexota bacterium]